MAYKKDEDYMHIALASAQLAFEHGEVPIGAVVVDQVGDIIGIERNRTQANGCQAEHAEINAIRAACAMRGDWRLDGCSLYVNLEPCVMCLGCIVLSRIERLVYGARSPQFGYHFGRENMCELYAQKIKNITEGVCAQESQALLQQFFKDRR